MKFSNLYNLSAQLDRLGLFKVSDKIERTIVRYSQTEEELLNDTDINDEDFFMLDELDEFQNNQQLLQRQKSIVQPPIVKNSLEDLARINMLQNISPFEAGELAKKNKKSVSI